VVSNRLKSTRTDNSFANEFGTIDQTLKKLRIHGGFLVDIGAADGIRQSSTSNFLNKITWSGLLLECDGESFAKLSFLYNDQKNLSLARTKVFPTNIVNLLKGFEVPQSFEFLNIDIDSYDLEVLRTIITAGYRPKLISMEINEKFPPNVDFEVLFNKEHSWGGDHFFGCSVSSATKTLNKHGYQLSRMEFNNAIFVDCDGDINDQAADLWSIYDEGYWNNPYRDVLFPWNADVNHFYRLDASILEYEILEKFSKYKGKYTLEVHEF
jgi:hypothetical protein